MFSRPVRVLFVCLGNICRSPMAEAVFQHKVEQAGLADIIEADSAGTGSWHVGEPPHPGTRRTLAAKQIEYRHAARQVQRADLDAFDYIVTMDTQNMRDVRRLGIGSANLVTLLSYTPDVGHEDLADPWYTGDFEATYRSVERAVDSLLAEIRAEHGV